MQTNSQTAEDTGLGAQAHIGRKMRKITPDLWDEIGGIFEIAIATGQPVLLHRVEGATVSPAGERRVFMTDCHPVRIGNGILAIGAIFHDITEQTEMQAERCRVMLELQHRNKNILSNVLALGRRARRDAGPAVGVLDILAMWIKARSNTQKLLTQENWYAANIYALIRPELTDIYGPERVHLAGPQLQLNARAVVALAVAVYELATNGAKYDVFSQGSGNVARTWMRIEYGVDERVVFRWTETCGPKVAGQLGGGFGSQMIASTITRSFLGAIEMNWRSEGLLVEISIPYEAFRET